MRLRYLLCGLLTVAGISGCSTTYPPIVTSDGKSAGVFLSPNGPSPTPLPATQFDNIEYRVSGTPNSVVVRFSNSTDGLTQMETSLPFSVMMRSSASSIFLSLDAMSAQGNFLTPYPFLSAQIFVNGSLFREATSTNMAHLVSVSGTWRH